MNSSSIYNCWVSQAPPNLHAAFTAVSINKQQRDLSKLGGDAIFVSPGALGMALRGTLAAKGMFDVGYGGAAIYDGKYKEGMVKVGIGALEIVPAAVVGVGSTIKPSFNISIGKNPNQINHAWRHIDNLGIPRPIVEQTIRKDISLRNIDSLAIGKAHNFTVNVKGHSIQYTIYKINSKDINIGRIHGVR